MRTRFVSIAIALLAAGATLGAGQEATFKAAIRTVAVYATVTGPDGRLLPDLPREAFSVLDNGKPQTLTLFANDVQPITVVMLLDRSVSMRANFTLVEQAAERFVDALPTILRRPSRASSTSCTISTRSASPRPSWTASYMQSTFM